MHASLSLPDAPTPETFDAVRRDEPRLRPAVEALCRDLGLRGAITRFPDGSLPVYAVGEEHVLKLFPPYELDGRNTEAAALGAVAGRLPVPTPAVREVGERDGWGWVLMERLRGRLLDEAWPDLSADDRLGVAEQVGRMLAVLHRLEAPPDPGIRVDWGGFVESQRSSAVERQRSRGLEERWLTGIDAFLEWTPLGESRADALLHTEVMRDHLLVTVDREGPRLSGLFDFEPAMRGAPEYEFASVGLFVSCGDPGILRRVLLAYGYDEAALTPDMGRRLLAWALLHRYSNLPWFLRRMPPPTAARSLADLAAHWFGLSAD